jgi:hypothetical protein
MLWAVDRRARWVLVLRGRYIVPQGKASPQASGLILGWRSALLGLLALSVLLAGQLFGGG